MSDPYSNWQDDNWQTETQSYIWKLRESFIAALLRLPFFAKFNFRRNPHIGPIQISELPILGVYIGTENAEPDNSQGSREGNMGLIAFTTRTQIIFSVILRNNDPAQLEQQLDNAYWALVNGLWRNQYLTNLLSTWNDTLGAYETIDNTRFEAIERSQRRFRYGASGVNNTEPWGELEYMITIRNRNSFPPTDFDDLLTFHGQAFPGGSDTSSVEPVEYQWDLSGNVPPYDLSGEIPSTQKTKGKDDVLVSSAETANAAERPSRKP